MNLIWELNQETTAAYVPLISKSDNMIIKCWQGPDRWNSNAV